MVFGELCNVTSGVSKSWPGNVRHENGWFKWQLVMGNITHVYYTLFLNSLWFYCKTRQTKWYRSLYAYF